MGPRACKTKRDQETEKDNEIEKDNETEKDDKNKRPRARVRPTPRPRAPARPRPQECKHKSTALADCCTCVEGVGGARQTANLRDSMRPRRRVVVGGDAVYSGNKTNIESKRGKFQSAGRGTSTYRRASNGAQEYRLRSRSSRTGAAMPERRAHAACKQRKGLIVIGQEIEGRARQDERERGEDKWTRGWKTY